jgi:hypothetical protein
METVVNATCEKVVSREELERKLSGKPDFVLEEHYCVGQEAYCQDSACCVELVGPRGPAEPLPAGVTLYGFYDSRKR